MITELDLIKEVGEWAEQNFGEMRMPQLGIVEEIGELCHARLKRFQKIRGYDLEEKFMDDYVDSLADAMIFLCDWCARNNAFFQFDKCVTTKPEYVSFEIVMQHILQACSALFRTNATETPTICISIAQQITQGLTYLACEFNTSLPLAVNATWLKVKERNWKKNPKEGI